MMKILLTSLTICMSDFRKNPSRVLRKAGQKPVAVLKKNKPAFYMVEPRLFESMNERLADIELMPLLKRRYAQRADSVEVNIDDADTPSTRTDSVTDSHPKSTI